MRIALGSALLFALVACSGAKPASAPASTKAHEEAVAAPPRAQVTDAGPRIPRAPAPEPKMLLGMIGLASPVALQAELGRFVDAVSPGMGAVVTGIPLETVGGELVGGELAGVDYGRPMWVLMLDPDELPGLTPLVVVVAVNERDAFDAAARSLELVTVHDRGYAAVGARDAIAIAAP